MANIKFTNFARSKVATGINSSATTLAITGGTGALFPALTGAEYFYLTLENSSLVREIVKVTARTADTLTIVRAQDGTTAAAWVAGDVVSLRFNAAAIADAVTGTLLAANNLSDVANAATARANLGALAAGDNIGSSTATTQTAGDNSTKVATTAYADTTASFHKFGAYQILSASGSISSGSIGGLTLIDAASATVDMPAIPSAGKTVTIWNGLFSVATTLTTPGSELFVAVGAWGQPTMTLQPGEGITLLSNGTDWIQAGAGPVGSAASKAANGYTKLSSGVIIQWGTDTLNSGTVITFPIAFPTACASVTATATGLYVAGVSAVSTTTFTGNCYRALTEVATAVSCKWIAIGY